MRIAVDQARPDSCMAISEHCLKTSNKNVEEIHIKLRAEDESMYEILEAMSIGVELFSDLVRESIRCACQSFSRVLPSRLSVSGSSNCKSCFEYEIVHLWRSHFKYLTPNMNS